MIKELKALSDWLKAGGYIRTSQMVEDLSEYDEPWHEEAVKEFGSDTVDEDKYFEDNFYEDKKPLSDYIEKPIDYKIMEKEGFKYYAPGSKSEYLSSGVFGSVYRGIYNGSPAVIKVMRGKSTRNDDNEVANWKAILEAKPGLTPEMQKHIPNIYKVNSSSITYQSRTDYIPGKDSDVYGPKDIKYEVVIMEELFPLDRNMQEAFYRDGKTD